MCVLGANILTYKKGSTNGTRGQHHLNDFVLLYSNGEILSQNPYLGLKMNVPKPEESL